MKKICLSIIISILLCLIFFHHSYAEKNALVIFNLKATNIEAMGYNGDILHALISSIECDKKIELMPRREIEEVLFKANIVQDNTNDAVLAAGKALGINFILFGEVTKKGSDIEAKLKLMDIQQSKIIKNWDLIFRDRDAILKKIPDISNELNEILSNYSTGIATELEYLNAKLEGDIVSLSWKLKTNKASLSYNVYRSESENSPCQLLGKTTDCYFQDSTIKKGLTYFYRIGIVAGTDPEIKSSPTKILIAALEKRPYPPLIISGKGYVKRIEIKFVPSLKNEQEKYKITKYKIYRQKGPNEWKNIGVTDAKSASQFDIDFTIFDESDLKDGSTYTYALSGFDENNSESLMSDPLQVNTITNPVLSLNKDGLLRKVILSWKSVDSVKGYCLYRKTDTTGWKKVADISGAANTTVMDEKDMSDGQQYLYYLTAYDDKKETGPSNEVLAKTKNLPAFPVNLVATSGLVKSVRISWNPIDDTDIDGYNIYRGTDNNNIKKITYVKGNKSDNYIDKGDAFIPLEDGKTYFYAISGVNLFEAAGPVSPSVKAVTKPRPAPVNGLKASAEADHISINWEKSSESDIKSYFVYRSVSSGSILSSPAGGAWSKLKELSADQTSYIDFDLKQESIYIYRIISEDKDGLKSDPAESGQVISPIVKQEKLK